MITRCFERWGSRDRKKGLNIVFSNTIDDLALDAFFRRGRSLLAGYCISCLRKL